MTRAARWWSLFCALCAGCAHEVRPRLFVNAPPVWRVDDRRDTPVRPKHYEPWTSLNHLDATLTEPATRVLIWRDQPAHSVNSLGEVPDSSWFTNRITAREVSLDEIRRGPIEGPGPEGCLPWAITSAKTEGEAPGFFIKDRCGKKYLIKPDRRGHAEEESAAHIIVGRLLWACGYNVPDDRIVYFRREDVFLADGATARDGVRERRLDLRDVDLSFATFHRESSGRHRAIASRFLPGEPIGGTPRMGRRPDDPNDLVDHERRREIRGLYGIFSWLDNTDAKEGNTLDTWVESPPGSGRHHVVHYLLDFGKGLGVMGCVDDFRGSGFTHGFDIGDALVSTATLGLWRRPWDDRPGPPFPGLGLLETDRYNPADWRSLQQYTPFKQMTALDGFWAAKLLIRFTEAHLRTAVEEGRYSDPRAAEYVLKLLIERQRKTAAYWFSRVNPLDEFAVRGDGPDFELCFADLAVRHGLVAQGAVTPVGAVGTDADGRQLGWSSAGVTSTSGQVCLTGLRTASTPDAYTIVTVGTARAYATEPVRVHIAAAPGSGKLRIIGLERFENPLPE